MKLDQSEGIVLKSQEYKEHQRILMVYTQDFGLISLIVKGLSQKKPSLLAATTPFCIAEFIFRRGKSDLYLLTEVSTKEPLYSLRISLAHLQAAGEITQSVLRSQLPEKRSPDLYLLLRSFLLHLPHFSDPWPLTTSFFLKLLWHEGLLSEEELPSSFTQEEWTRALKLAQASHFSQFSSLNVSNDLFEKIKAYLRAKILI